MTLEMAIIKMIRPLNLVIIVMTSILIGAVLDTFIESELDWTKLLTYAFCLALIAAGGNVLNDIQDIETDKVNEKGRNQVGNLIPGFLAWTLYATLTFMGLFIAWMFNEGIDNCFILLSVATGLLLLYSLILQRHLIFGNLVVAILCSFPIILCGFVFLPKVFSSIYLSSLPTDLSTLTTPVIIVISYSLLAFVLTYMREVIKDIEDIEGDKESSYNTLPIALGISRTKNVVTLIGLSVLILEAYVIAELHSSQGNWSQSIYLGVLTLLPLAYITKQIAHIESPKDAEPISFYLKIGMLLGLSTCLFFAFL
jgi:4-hydroxybenzoate polyprenyltransferase